MWEYIKDVLRGIRKIISKFLDFDESPEYDDSDYEMCYIEIGLAVGVVVGTIIDIILNKWNYSLVTCALLGVIGGYAVLCYDKKKDEKNKEDE